jgi:hypothetical protein
MAKTEQGTATASGKPETAEILERAATMYGHGIDRIAEVQKKGLDLATRQNEDLIRSWKELAKAVPGAPGLPMLELITNAFDRYADTQKGAIDLVLTQSHALLGLAKKGAASVADAVAASDELAQQTVEQTVAAQKKALDDSSAMATAAFQRAKTQMGIAGTPAETAADALQRGVETLVSSQKELLDFAAKPLGTAKRSTGPQK